MKLFKHERKDAEPVAATVEPHEVATTPDPEAPATQPSVATMAFGRMTEHEENGDLVITTEMAGLDLDNDVELSVTDGMLRLEAQHREEATTEDDGFVRREVRMARFLRTLPLPAGVAEGDIKASYKDGVLEIRIPAGAPTKETPKAAKISITTA